jgi:hypothetical protein
VLPTDAVTIVAVHRTPSDWRNWQNTLRDFRRGGLEWPPKT